MPEHPEIRAFVNYFNSISDGVIFKDVFVFPGCENECNLKKRPYVSPPGDLSEFYIHSVQRGKQFRVDFYKVKNEDSEEVYSNENDNSEKLVEELLCEENYVASMVIGFGLTGFPLLATSLSNAKKNNAKLGFRSQTFLLTICASDIESVYWRYGDFSRRRSPDIVYEYELYRLNVYSYIEIYPPNYEELSAENKQFFSQSLERWRIVKAMDMNDYAKGNDAFNLIVNTEDSPLVGRKERYSSRDRDFFNDRIESTQKIVFVTVADYLLNQDLFNGVGNYLRAEILNRLKIYPLQPFESYIKRNKNNIDPLIATVRDIAEEAYSVIYDEEEFSNWIKCYGVANNAVKDSNGRVIWFWGDVARDEVEITPGDLETDYSGNRNVQGNYIAQPTDLDKYIKTYRSAANFQSVLRLSQGK